MAFEATQQLYEREAALLNARAQQETNRYLADLARQYGIASQNLNANLEGRGIYRSGEAATSRARLSAESQAMRSAALQDLEYRQNMTNINLLKQLASLQAQKQGTPSTTNFQPAASAAQTPSIPAVRATQPYRPQTTFNPQTNRPIASSEDRRVSGRR